MAERPLVFFSKPTKIEKDKRRGGPSDFAMPPHQKQIQRLSPQFKVLENAWRKSNQILTHAPKGFNPEYTLVLETAGDPAGFETAVRNLDKETQGLEWLFETVQEDVDNSDDFYRLNKKRQRDDTNTMTFKYFCVVTNHQALSEILTLWKRYKNGSSKFPRGKTGLKHVFDSLKDIHLWGSKERFDETGILQAWLDDLQDPEATQVFCEIELFYRRSEEKRTLAETIITRQINTMGGRIISASCIEQIHYHALLASIPRRYAEHILNRDEVVLIDLQEIMFIKPTGQSSVSCSTDGFSYPADMPKPSNILDEPIVALFDGLPQEQHPFLAGLLAIDDPDDYTAEYQINDRHHGTAMASLITRGDLLDDSQTLPTHKLYVRPIMKPYPNAGQTSTEFVPETVLIVDSLYKAILRLFEPAHGSAAPTVKVINLSIGVSSRIFYTMVSPLARLLDWLSFSYRVLFIVSAGNHAEDLSLPISFDAFKEMPIRERDTYITQFMHEQAHLHRLLSPAESINALTVGALFSDCSRWAETERHILPCSASMPSPINAIGRGINNAVKPDIIHRGGRNVVLANMLEPNTMHWRRGNSLNPPGILTARPFTLQNDNRVGYSFGTSNATALVAHQASQCFDVLDAAFLNDFGVHIPSDYAAVLLKAMLVHGAKWNESASIICKTLGISGRGNDIVHKWLGFGIPDFERVQHCVKNRITLIGFGTLSQDSACRYELPLPFRFSSRRMYRCLTVTLASLTPIHPSSQKYRTAQTWFSFDPTFSKLNLARLDVGDKAVVRGTLQHERFGGESATTWSDSDTLGIKINCRTDAKPNNEPIPYALFCTFEIAPQFDIDVYQRISERIRVKEIVSVTLQP